MKRDKVFLTVVTIILIGVFISLGFWQLHRAEEKRQLINLLNSKLKAKPIALQDLSNDLAVWQYQPVKFNGEFLNSNQFLLDNKINEGQVGYEVVTPVKVIGIKNLVLVDRGWIAAGNDRNILPEIKPVLGSQIIHGIIRMPLGKEFMLTADNFAENKWPIRIEQLDFKKMAAALHQSVYPFVVLLDTNAENGFVTQWEFVNMQPARHTAYAVQWFLFAGILFIIYVTLMFKRRRKNVKH